VQAGERYRWLAAAALCALSAAAHADYKDDYAHGLKAYREGDFAEARTLMQSALEQHAEPAARIRLYGQVYEPYLPQHYLGMAALKLGDCNAAAAQWSSSANKQIVGQLPDIGGEEQRGLASCGGKLAKNDDKPPVEPPKPNIEPSKPPVGDSKPPVVVADNKPPPVTPVKPPPPKPPVEDKPPVAKSGPPEPLVQAFDSYLAGRYTEVSRINPDAYADTRARFHAYVVRAAAKFTLSRLSTDDALLKSARADAIAARALDSRAPDATLFSPDFRAFFQESH